MGFICQLHKSSCVTFFPEVFWSYWISLNIWYIESFNLTYNLQVTFLRPVLGDTNNDLPASICFFTKLGKHFPVRNQSEQNVDPGVLPIKPIQYATQNCFQVGLQAIKDFQDPLILMIILNFEVMFFLLFNDDRNNFHKITDFNQKLNNLDNPILITEIRRWYNAELATIFFRGYYPSNRKTNNYITDFISQSLFDAIQIMTFHWNNCVLYQNKRFSHSVVYLEHSNKVKFNKSLFYLIQNLLPMLNEFHLITKALFMSRHCDIVTVWLKVFLEYIIN